ncbi:hypothetical protein R1flu_003646 [Riccia fluitans]|uniref:Uncharacterized protein n=1 Tax=Riccia fluitans TaxID=41844 RepID=A0ABD1Y9N1_9MARC
MNTIPVGKLEYLTLGTETLRFIRRSGYRDLYQQNPCCVLKNPLALLLGKVRPSRWPNQGVEGASSNLESNDASQRNSRLTNEQSNQAVTVFLYQGSKSCWFVSSAAMPWPSGLGLECRRGPFSSVRVGPSLVLQFLKRSSSATTEPAYSEPPPIATRLLISRLL